eukprot:3092204-Alexandrium_andersonii.AAC.1
MHPIPKVVREIAHQVLEIFDAQPWENLHRRVSLMRLSPSSPLRASIGGMAAGEDPAGMSADFTAALAPPKFAPAVER